MCVKASGVIGEGSQSFPILEKFEAKKRGIFCAVYRKLLKLTLRSKNYTTVKNLIEAIISVWYHDDKIAKCCQKLVSTMPKRVEKVLKNKEAIYRIKCKNCFVF